MRSDVSTEIPVCLDERHSNFVREEFRPDDTSVSYLNWGSVGRKPESVLAAVNQGWRRLNDNPTRVTYLEDDIKENARQSLAELFDVDKECLLLTDSTTQALQLILSSLLTRAGDEVIITSREHGSSRTILRYLEDSRGIRVRTYNVEAGCSTEQMSLELLNLITGNTRLVLISEIDCYSGWRPELTLLNESLKLLDIPLLVDGAHAPGNGPTRPGRYPLWVGAGHKWLSAPNSTGFALVSRDFIPLLNPVWLGDGFYETREAEIYDLRRFEHKGNPDVVKWLGLTEAVRLYQSLDRKHIDAYQKGLVLYLRTRLMLMDGVRVRYPGYHNPEGEEQASMITFHAKPERWKVADLRAALWQDHKIWIQPDFLSPHPGSGGRISCHYSVTRDELDRFLSALESYLN